jgi:hypothetical protein
LPSPTIEGDYAKFLADEVTNRHKGICFILGSSPSLAEDTVIQGKRIHNWARLQRTDSNHSIYVSAARGMSIMDNWIYNNADEVSSSTLTRTTRWSRITSKVLRRCNLKCGLSWPKPFGAVALTPASGVLDVFVAASFTSVLMPSAGSSPLLVNSSQEDGRHFLRRPDPPVPAVVQRLIDLPGDPHMV